MLTQPVTEEAIPTLREMLTTYPLDYSKLEDDEVIWRDLQPWLEQRGYMLRPRYRVGWVPKWKGTEISRFDYEDANEMTVRPFHLTF